MSPDRYDAGPLECEAIVRGEDMPPLTAKPRRLLYAAVGIALGMAIGILLLLAGGLIPPSPQPCPGCAILVHPTPQCHTPVQGGFTC